MNLNQTLKKAAYSDKTVIFLAVTGSRAYGLETPESDVDIRGIYLKSSKELLGFEQPAQVRKLNSTDADSVIWSLEHAIRCVIKGDANVLEAIHSPHKYIIPGNEGAAEWLLSDHFKQLTVTKRAIRGYLGFTAAQKLRWIKGNNKPGSKRTERINKHGYDSKNAAHAYRSIRMAHKMTTTNKFSLDCREFKDKFLAIKNGEVTLENVRTRIDTYWEAVTLALTDGTCTLPDEPDKEALAEFCMELNWGTVTQD